MALPGSFLTKFAQNKGDFCTLIQVAELKTQLATQEVELTRKNDEADKLIEIVGVETEKVSNEKASADEEELKVRSTLLVSYLKCKGESEQQKTIR